MNARSLPALFALTLIGMTAASRGRATAAALQPMPAQLESQFALSAAPKGLRDRATVYVLDPRSGYHLSHQGASGVTCIVERTAWEMADFRDDIYIPLCYDAVGTRTYLQVIMDAAALRAQGMSAPAVKAEIEKRYQAKTYRAPEKPGLSYMVSPVMRAGGPPDMQVHTMSMPHLMFYAPFVTNDDIAAAPDLAVPATLRYPFVDRQGNGEQSYMIQLLGETARARILVDEAPLIHALCAYRSVLCLADMTH